MKFDKLNLLWIATWKCVRYIQKLTRDCCCVTQAKKAFLRKMMHTTKNSSNWRSLIGQSDWDLYHFLTEKLVEAGTITPIGRPKPCWSKTVRVAIYVILEDSKKLNFLLGDEANKSTVSGNFHQPRLLTVGWCNLSFWTCSPIRESKIYLWETSRGLIQGLVRLHK
jgi:hypothetical protein